MTDKEMEAFCCMIKKFIPIFLLLVTICTIIPFTKAEAVSYDIDFETKTEAIELVNLDTDTVVFSKNPDKKMYPASTTKIMTYIIAVEAIKDLEGTTLTVKNRFWIPCWEPAAHWQVFMMAKSLPFCNCLT